MRKLLSHVVSAVTSEAAKAVAVWLVPTLGPVAGVWYFKGIVFFETLHPVPGWVITAGLASIVALVMVGASRCIMVVRRRSRRRPRVLLHGMEWEVDPTFFDLYATTLVGDFDSYDSVRDIVVGPFCPACKADVSGSVRSRRCDACGNGIALDVSDALLGQTRVVDILRRKAYWEAQAMARRGRLTRRTRRLSVDP